MNRIRLKDGKTVGYYYKRNIEEDNSEEDYAIFIVDSDAKEKGQKLAERGFCFADRSLRIEMPIKNWNGKMKAGKKQKFIISEDWNPKEIYQIAKHEFTRDCRFAVDIGIWNQEVKNELLYNFIARLREKKYMATCCYIENKLEGFNLWSLEENTGTILLGAVTERYEGTGIAMYMYSSTLQWMKNHAGEFLLNNVFSSNLQSINFHIALSSWGEVRMKIKEYKDWYVKCREYTGKEI